MREPNRGSFSFPPRMARMRPRTFSFLSGKWVSSHCSNSGATVTHGCWGHNSTPGHSVLALHIEKVLNFASFARRGRGAEPVALEMSQRALARPARGTRGRKSGYHILPASATFASCYRRCQRHCGSTGGRSRLLTCTSKGVNCAFGGANPSRNALKGWNCSAKLLTLMIPLPREIQDFLRLLNANAIRYLVIGGWIPIDVPFQRDALKTVGRVAGRAPSAWRWRFADHILSIRQEGGVAQMRTRDSVGGTPTAAVESRRREAMAGPATALLEKSLMITVSKTK